MARGGEANVDKNEVFFGAINMHQKEGVEGSPSVCLHEYMYTSYFFFIQKMASDTKEEDLGK